jgi:hypothetical protein
MKTTCKLKMAHRSHLRRPHDFMNMRCARLASIIAPDATTFTQPLQNEESIRAFPRERNMRRQRLGPQLRLSEMAGAVKAERRLCRRNASCFAALHRRQDADRIKKSVSLRNDIQRA